MIIAVDVAGGDYAPSEIIKGAVQAAEESEIEVALVGKKSTDPCDRSQTTEKSPDFDRGCQPGN